MREPACAPAPMIARLIGIIGSTQGVRFNARPPSRTSTRIASDAAILEHPFFLDARLGVADELEEGVVIPDSRPRSR